MQQQYALAVAVLLLLAGLQTIYAALTTEQIAFFKARTTTETNTGKSGSVTVTTGSDKYIFSSNSIPDHATATYPNKDNPNSLTEVTMSVEIPLTPVTTEESCLPMGPIGMAVNGVPIYNPYTIEKTDAIENEVMDSCGGHPSPNGQYHYHGIPPCLYNNEKDKVIGISFDGHLIYGPILANGTTLTSNDLDKCNGVTIDGVYRYVATTQFPYYLGCYRGNVIKKSGGKCYFSYNTNAENAATRSTAAVPGLLLAVAAVVMAIH